MKIEQMTDLTLPLWGKEILYSSERTTFFVLERMFRLSANRAQEHFIELYRKENKNLGDVFKKGQEQGDKVIVAALTFWANVLVESGYYDIDETELISLYSKTDAYLYWEQAYDKIAEKYVALEFNKEQQEAYRKARKDSRGRIIGGGFGLVGAAKGIATAGAINLTTGAVHSTVNMVGNTITRAKIGMQKEKLFSDDATLKELATGIYLAVYHARNAILAYLHSTNTVAFSPISASEEKECATRLANYKKLNFPDDKLKEELFYLLNLNPFNLEIYLYALERFGDNTGELTHITELFWLTDSFNEYKLDRFSSYIQNTVYKLQDYKTWLRDAISYAKNLGVSLSDEALMDKVNSLLTTTLIGTWKEEIDNEIASIQSQYNIRDCQRISALNSYSEKCVQFYGIANEPIKEDFTILINHGKVFLINEAMKNAPMNNFEEYKTSKKLFEDMLDIAGLHRTDSRFSLIQKSLDDSIESLVKSSLQKIRGERKGFFGTGEYKVLPPQTLEEWGNIYNEIESLNLKDNAPQIFAKYATEICELEKATRTVNGVVYSNAEDAQQKEMEKFSVEEIVLNTLKTEIGESTVNYYLNKGDMEYLLSRIKNGFKFDSMISEIEKLNIDESIKEQKINELKQQKDNLRNKKYQEKRYCEMYEEDKRERKKYLVITILVTLALILFNIGPSWVKIIALIAVVGMGASYKEVCDDLKRTQKEYEEIIGVDED